MLLAKPIMAVLDHVFPSSKDRRERRVRMVAEQLVARGIENRHVLAAMGQVPRHVFVPEPLRQYAYEDRALPIGYGQSISRPYIVALMTQAADVREGDSVLEVGTGSGYQAAILWRIGAEVWSAEVNPELAQTAELAFESCGIRDVHLVVTDGAHGVPTGAPYDAIIVTASASEIPVALLDQLCEGGRLVIPIGRGDAQELMLITKCAGGAEVEALGSCVFVPLVRGSGACLGPPGMRP
jgi:protein-L-isoaspartate(D-aspartate) O-methyltransferase